MSLTYPIIVESGKQNYSAFVPDIPGCVSTGQTEAETLANMREALELHLAGILEDGDSIPAPSANMPQLEAGKTLHQIAINVVASIKA